jgi:hypothetical protein
MYSPWEFCSRAPKMPPALEEHLTQNLVGLLKSGTLDVIMIALPFDWSSHSVSPGGADFEGPKSLTSFPSPSSLEDPRTHHVGRVIAPLIQLCNLLPEVAFDRMRGTYQVTFR